MNSPQGQIDTAALTEVSIPEQESKMFSLTKINVIALSAEEKQY